MAILSVRSNKAQALWNKPTKNKEKKTVRAQFCSNKKVAKGLQNEVIMIC